MTEAPKVQSLYIYVIRGGARFLGGTGVTEI